MRRSWAFAALALALVIGATGCNKPAVTSKAAIAEVARNLDAPLGAMPNGTKLALPDNYSELNLGTFIKDYNLVFAQDWIIFLQQQHLDIGWPGDLRYIGHGRGDGPTFLHTTCPGLNKQRAVVSPDTNTIFYCVTDRMMVPGMLSYPQGTLWVPLRALLRPINRAAPSAIALGQQAAQALFVELTASWADGLSRQIRAAAADAWKINLPKLEQVNLALKFAFCVAGAMGRAVFGQYSAVPNAVYMLFGDETQPPHSVNAAALKDGFAKGTIGECVRSYWPATP